MNHTRIPDTPSQQLEARHRTSGLNSQFNGGQMDFADYVARQREMIARARSDADAAILEKIIDGNAPFELKPIVNYSAGHKKPYKRCSPTA